jgi:hypothetical protein
MVLIKNVKRCWLLKLISTNEISDKGAEKLGESFTKLVRLTSLNLEIK